MSPSFRFLLILYFVTLTGRLLFSDEVADRAEREQAALDTRISLLIEQLGSSDFPIREKAQRELTHIGLPAFDALQEAQFHRDLEIGLRARYLIGSADIAWTRDDDPPEVKSTLKNYSRQTEQERLARLGRLGRLEGHAGHSALCRLARYEREEPLSKLAALAIIQQEPPTNEELPEVIRSLQLGAGQSRRQAAVWLRAYARWLREPESVGAEWNRVVTEEFELLKSQPLKTSEDVVVALARWHAESLYKLGHEQEVKAIVQRLDGMLEGGREKLPEKLTNHVDWLGHCQMWSLVLDAHQRYAGLFAETPMLLYRLAEAKRHLNDNAEAVATAAAALALHPDDAPGHVKAGQELSERGLFDWAEAEYRFVISKGRVTDTVTVWARVSLSEMLHDQEKELPAAEVLQVVATELESKRDEFGKQQPNPMQQALESMGREPESLLSRMNYFYALAHLQQGRTKEATARLMAGAEHDPSDADVLIALYRLPGKSPKEMEQIKQLIAAAATNFQERITENGRTLAQMQAQLPSDALEGYRRQLALSHNQFAWLVANTAGDSEAAIAASHESLKLRPGEPAYLDTLGRCYFAKGDLTSAIKYQSEAVRKEPHSGAMRRQLAFFKAEAEQRK